jgi:hypothetical protein
VTFIGVDMTEVNALAADLVASSFKVLPGAEKVIDVGAAKVKKSAAKRIKAADRAGRLPGYPSSITYDTGTAGTKVGAVIGPDKDRNQGPLGNVLEYGTSDTPPIPHLQPALEAEAPVVEQLLAELVVGIIAAPGPSATRMVEYTTRAGKTRMATEAQVANWTRGAR